MFAQDYMLKSVSVRGEISNLKKHGSGHIYFSLKDEGALIACVMFAGNAKNLKLELEEGMEAVCAGSVEVYQKDGRYQLYVRDIKKEGRGSLAEEFEKLKEKLAEMGLFAPEYKVPLPKHPKTVGIVTAPTGAAVRDIIQISKRRDPYVQLILYPALVQGESAPESITAGIKALEKYGVDVMIVGRGGGSMEDLWAFNDERVAQAIFDCSIPVISAVGHETDFTIADFVADLRAPTPSAAAELAVDRVADIIEHLDELERRLKRNMQQILADRRRRSVYYENILAKLSPEGRIRACRERAAINLDRLDRNMNMKLTAARHRYAVLLEKMRYISPLKRLGGGYVYASGEDGKGLVSAAELSKGDSIRLRFRDGVVKAEVKESISEEMTDG
ncbi:MAG: exodeoxyribonuclease VII large subunit [Lachnospiraceae bacterium]|nr:exodeoxyribonuclease VII large subunit [Lachnospiraceae bacterium]